MAINIIHDEVERLSLVCSDPTTPASGDPVRFGTVTGLAETDERTDGTTTVVVNQFVADLSVKAVDSSGNSAVAVGDRIYYVDADTPKLSKKSTGYFYGFALEAITSSSTDTINVLHTQPGAPVGINLTGFIPLSLANAVLLSSNAVQNTTEGGRLDGNSAPSLTRVNGATDIAFRAEWAANGVAEIQWDVPLPPDLNDASTIRVKLVIEKDANTDTTAVVGVKFFQGKGDANAGGNTAALAVATITTYTVTIAAADVLAYSAAPFANIALVPGTHANDAVRLYAAWLEYDRV